MENDQIYIAGLNLSGLWSKKPLKAKWFQDLGEWYASEGPLKNNVSAKCLGHHNRDGVITFASHSKEKVQIWIDGVQSSFFLLKNWIR